MKERQKPIGLARPIQPEARPLVTHRGAGAFTQASFDMEATVRRQGSIQQGDLMPEVDGDPISHPTGGTHFMLMQLA